MAALFYFLVFVVRVLFVEGEEGNNCTEEWDLTVTNGTLRWTGQDRDAFIEVNVTSINTTDSNCTETRTFRAVFKDRELPSAVYHCLNFDYRINVSLICEEKTVDTKSILLRTQAETLGPPTNVTAVEVTNKTITLEWERPSYGSASINGYIVRHAKKSNFDGNEINMAANTSHELPGLIPYTKYFIGVRASTSDGDGPWSETLPVLTDVGVPFAPMNVSAASVTNSSIEVTWQEPEQNRGPITSYKIKWKNQKSLLEDSKDVSDKSYVIESLDPYIDYLISIQAETKAGAGPWSASLTVRTKVGVPSAPTELKATNFTSKSIFLEWKEPDPTNGPLMGYIMSWGVRGAAVSQDLVINSSFYAEDLLPYTEYSFQVIARNEAGFGPYSERLYVSTAVDIPSSPRNLTEVEVTNTSISIEWVVPEHPNGPLLTYIIQLYEYDDYPNGTAREIETNLTNHVIDGLTAYTTYFIQVCALTEAGRGDFHGDLTIRTKIGIPSAPRNMSTTRVRATDITLRWSIPDPVGGPLLDYSISWGVQGTNASVVVTEDTFYEAIGLRPFTEYYFELAARTVAGSGFPSFMIIRTDIAAPGIPRDLQVIDVTDNSALIEWLSPEHPNGPNLSYKVTWFVESRNSTHAEVTNVTNYLITSLDSSTNYFVCISAINEAGQGDLSETLFIRTSDKKPPTTNSSLVLALVLGILLPLIVIALVVGLIVARRKEVLKWFRSKDTATPPRSRPATRPTIQLQIVTPHTEPTTTKCLTVHNFEEQVNNIIRKGQIEFTQEFEELKKQSPQHSCNAAKLNENLIKNRWVKILPFDYSRVKLLPDGPGLRSNFINATYIPGDSYLLEYIASQGTLSNTLDDFWTMVWQQSVPVIVMLTQCVERAVKNCERYWPSAGETKLYGNVQVHSKSESILTSHVSRVFVLQHQNHKRHVIQMHFTNWPVSGVPRSPEEFLHFVSQVRSHLSDRRPGPILVHCSAGVGRTGTFIAVDRLWQHLQCSEDIDIFGTVLDMRRYRPHMVHTEDQYVFIYSCIQKLLQERNQSVVDNIYETLPI